MLYNSYLLENNFQSLKENLVLFYGENEGLKQEFKKKILTLGNKDEIINFNLKQFLHNEEILIEKEFRTKVKSYNFKSLQNKVVGLYCDENIILPMWAFMLISCNLKKHNITFFTNIHQQVGLLMKILNFF